MFCKFYKIEQNVQNMNEIIRLKMVFNFLSPTKLLDWKKQVILPRI